MQLKLQLSNVGLVTETQLLLLKQLLQQLKKNKKHFKFKDKIPNSLYL
jgi:hypothetical protein